MIRKLSLAFVALSLAACASANKRFEQGQKLQNEGKPAEAAERYIQALKKDSKLDSARAGLRRAGTAAMEMYMATASNPATQAPAAADSYLAFDDLQRRALEVGVFLPEPINYATNRRMAFDKAIARAISDAPLLIPQGQHADALARLQRAATAYQPAPAQVSAIAVTGSDVMIAWAKADTTAGNFRAAYGRVEHMGDAPGATQRQLDDARALQAAALARGTRRIAVVAPWATIAARNNLPEDALPALGDAMSENPWLSPPQFIAMFPADQVDREVRRFGLARRTLSSLEASRIARSLGADLIVVTEVDSVRREDVNVRVTRRPVRTRSGVDTAFFVEEGTARLYARASINVIDRDGQRAPDFPWANASVTAPFTRVRYNGDYRLLDLRQADRDLFDRSRTEGDLARTLAGVLSPRLAEGVFNEVMRRIP